MSFRFSDSTPAAASGMENVEFQHSGTTDVLASAQYKKDVSVATPTGTGSITIAAIETIELVTNSSSPVADITRTLPAASGASGRIVLVKKVDSGTGAVIVQGNGSPAESVDTIYTFWELTNQNQYVRLLCDGTGWHVIGNN